MTLSRRSLAALAVALPAAPAIAQQDPRLAVRETGRADAPVVVQEYFSLTCGHCANFHNNVWPEVKSKLVEPGRVRLIWRDFPLDGVALAAACIARSLPADRYEGFITILFQTQNRWAYAEGRQLEELARLASMAGMSRPDFDKAVADEALRRAVFEQRQEAVRRYNITATPSFLFNSRLHTGGLDFARFQQAVQDAPRA
ncbi:DsbA family protein [Sabulicella rubraurantiaca]|uniref:DsbA family protein n=1 Tax=Sabulicella rubraurantiaca TaxID=2811429 RepID=UPI001A97AB1C|nr:thioredoxin domain-containing protein [Sabulicella rubraurantiaca]